jgi:murein L,D-transpeptidase YcbB/YkuD
LNLAALLLIVPLLTCALLSHAHAGDEQLVSDQIRIRLRVVPVQPDTTVQGVYLAAPRDLASLYLARDYAPVWSRGGQLQPRAGSLLTAIQAAGREGLDPHNYHADKIGSIIDQVLRGDSDAQLRAEADLILTDALLGYAGDLRQGRLRGHPLRKGMAAESTDLDHHSFLTMVLSDGVETSLSSLAPKSPAYARLRETLLYFRELNETETAFSIPDHSLEQGDTGAAVASLRRRLSFLGDLHGAHGDEETFDEMLQQAVLRFQVRHGLEADGVVGPKTNAALAVPMAERVAQIEYNMERLRWLPQTPDPRYIVVNIAGFTLEVIERGEPVLKLRAIVGKSSQQTPIFSSSVTSIVLNPYWNVPYSIATKEILPRLRREPDYLEREQLRILKREGSGTIEVDPATVDWNTVSRSNFPYLLRQDPGPDNSLGQVKFFLPNPYSVFIHDTPAKSLFNHAARAFSHGCVRLEKPFELATYLLADQPEWTGHGMGIAAMLDQANDKWVNPTEPIPIHMVYWTAWVDSKDTVNFRRDIYRRDQHLSLALESLSLLQL